MELRGDRVVLRPLAQADVARLVELGSEPEVARWWPGLTAEHVGRKARGEDEGVTAFAIVVAGGTGSDAEGGGAGEVAGLVQYYEETDPDYRHAGLDLFLGVSYHGRGLGTDTVRTMARHLVRGLGHHRLVIDPALENERAVRCYEGAGFRRVGVMREYWRDGGGVWRDGLLLDLLAAELD